MPKKIYIVLSAIFAASFISLLLWPQIEAIKTFAAIPLVGSLVLALFQILRDQVAHAHNLIAIDRQNNFALGVSSHMANLAFSRHVEFAEKYLIEVLETLKTLATEGPTSQALNHSFNLRRLREEYALWLTAKIDEELGEFERVVTNIGSSAHYTQVAPNGDQFITHQNRQYKLYAQFMDFGEWDGEALTDELAYRKLIDKLREILGTRELTEMRAHLLSDSISAVRSS